MENKNLIDRLRYYGTTYTSGDNLGREIQGTDELLFEAVDVIERLEAELNSVSVAHGHWCDHYDMDVEENGFCSNGKIK